MSAMAAELAGEFPDTNEGWGMTARPLRSELLGDLAPMLWVLSGAVFLVLLTACANIANVLVARSTAASREFAVRAALGARPRDLCIRSLSESLILGVVGGAGGMLLAFWGAAFLRSVMPAEIPRLGALGVDWLVLLVGAVLSIGSTVLFGSLPALRSIKPDLHELLKPAGASATATAGGQRLREVMVVVEVALAIVLLVGTGLMVRSFARLSEVDPGFRQDGVVSVTVQIPTSRYARSEFRLFFEQFVERVGQIPGVKAAGAVSDLLMSNVGISLEMEFTVLGLDAAMPTANPNAEIRLVIPGYFNAMGMELVRGRVFDRLDTSSERSVGIVNETLVERYFPDFDPIGRSVIVKGIAEVEIVGVAADVRSGGLQSKYESGIFLPYGRIAVQQMQVVAQSDLGTAAVARAVGDVLADMDPQLAPSEVAALSDLLWESVAQPRFNAALLSSLALCAAILAVVGTYGIVSYSVAQRTSEIGVRMALGADAAATVSMIVRQALRIVLVGAALGILGAVGATRFLNQLLFEVQPNDLVTCGVVLSAAILVGLLAAWLPARRATRIDPVSALRHE
jgi:putative ABC transport system permease protein